MSTAIRRALYGKLAGDTTLNNLLGTPAAGYTKAIYHQQAPGGARYPYVVFNKQAGTPTEAMSDPSAYDTDIWLIKGVDRGASADNAEAIAERIQTLLNDTTLSISGGDLMYLRRQSDVQYSEVSDGETFSHCGSLYRLVWQSAARRKPPTHRERPPGLARNRPNRRTGGGSTRRSGSHPWPSSFSGTRSSRSTG